MKADGLEEPQKKWQYSSSVFWTVPQNTFPAVIGRYIQFYSINPGRVHLTNPVVGLLCLIPSAWVSSLTQGFVWLILRALLLWGFTAKLPCLLPTWLGTSTADHEHVFPLLPWQCRPLFASPFAGRWLWTCVRQEFLLSWALSSVTCFHFGALSLRRFQACSLPAQGRKQVPGGPCSANMTMIWTAALEMKGSVMPSPSPWASRSSPFLYLQTACWHSIKHYFYIIIPCTDSSCSLVYPAVFLVVLNRVNNVYCAIHPNDDDECFRLV